VSEMEIGTLKIVDFSGTELWESPSINKNYIFGSGMTHDSVNLNLEKG